MINAKYILPGFLFMFNITLCSAQTRLDSLLDILKKSDFHNIYKARDSIVNYQVLAVPKLIELLSDTSYVKLTNTADLIYPGATQFYGHGWIVNYDLDYVNVRAAWILEKIVFKNFGYNTLTVNEDSLLKLHQQHYSKYLKDGFNAVNFKNKGPKEQLNIYRLLLAARVKEWWKKNSKGWSRFKAIKDALGGTNIKQQVNALQYLRDRIQSPPGTKCADLTTKSFYSDLYPLIEQIGKTNTEAKKEADYFLVYEKNVRF